jgi:hypothetical protein
MIIAGCNDDVLVDVEGLPTREPPGFAMFLIAASLNEMHLKNSLQIPEFRRQDSVRNT